ncbi:hypothetical protein F5B22DRAFT_182798 [Xylaria bambusicola]|uniref:uncharacterized protein n=1 Tax=Xylaria bambusicola TaxID=326684 RepID=UPI00200863C1|nr:uncharacterized protein F5B22DRAFT_182798 [Xylaria bambusicola]KAI0516836.1 hypothetical protein F5B22DRAFT_182798 [Xylaria bambusicola]
MWRGLLRARPLVTVISSIYIPKSCGGRSTPSRRGGFVSARNTPMSFEILYNYFKSSKYVRSTSRQLRKHVKNTRRSKFSRYLLIS